MAMTFTHDREDIRAVADDIRELKTIQENLDVWAAQTFGEAVSGNVLAAIADLDLDEVSPRKLTEAIDGALRKHADEYAPYALPPKLEDLDAAIDKALQARL